MKDRVVGAVVFAVLVAAIPVLYPIGRWLEWRDERRYGPPADDVDPWWPDAQVVNW